MPGTSKISDYVGFRCPKPLLADMERIRRTYDPPIPLSQWIILALSEGVKTVMIIVPKVTTPSKDDLKKVTTPDLPKVTTPKLYLDKYHHSISGYRYGCRCNVCKHAHKVEVTNWRKRKKSSHVHTQA